MPNPGTAWWHVIINARGTWLHGDPRGFRSRKHKIHSGGNYRCPPPLSEHQPLHEYQKARTNRPVHFEAAHQRVIGEGLLRGAELADVRCIAYAVSFTHAHLLVEIADDLSVVRKLVGRLKRNASRSVHTLLPGRIWADGGNYVRIRDRSHQLRVFHYIAEHEGKEDAWIWSVGG